VLQTNIAVGWDGLPAYAANAVRRGLEVVEYAIPVIATKPNVPFKDIENILNQKIKWIQRDSSKKWSDMNLPVPDIFFVSGWGGVFENLIQEVHLHGGKIISMTDRTWEFTYRNLREWLKFRLVYARRVDAIWVPGKLGVKNASRYGFKKHNIYTGVYTAITDYFKSGFPLEERPKKFIFIGRYEPVKNINVLVDAFKEFRKKHSDWILETYGCGSLSSKLDKEMGIRKYGFVQPELLAAKLRDARFLILPSVKEPWGLVVHEASCCGCGLILSNKIGSSFDLGSGENMWSFKSGDIEGLVNALCTVANLNAKQLQEVRTTSLRNSDKISPERWASVFKAIINKYTTL